MISCKAIASATPAFVAVVAAGLMMSILLNGCGGGGGGGASAQTGNVSGRAYDLSTNVAVAGATVSAGGLQTTTGSDGRFTLHDLPTGPVTIVVTKQSQQGQVTVTVVGGATINVEIPMLDATPPPPPM